MEKISNNLLKESYYHLTLDNGMEVFLSPKQKFKRSFAMLSVKYGSLHQEFKLPGSNLTVKTPAGVAHYLEHKMFELPGGVDATNLFASLGADVNAYTTYENTSYYFSTVNNFYESLKLLLDFVLTPCFVEESINSERGIIEQEILSTFDRPSGVAYNGILNNMFKENKVRVDIGGTKESIKDINKDVLDMCYNTFYHPSNMILVLAGCFDLDKTINLIKDNLNGKTFNKYLNPQVIYYLENNVCNKVTDTYFMDIAIPHVSLGVKLDLAAYSPTEIQKQAILLDFILEELFSYSSSNYQKWLREGLIDYTFEYTFSLSSKYSFITLESQVTDIDKFIKTIKDELLDIPNKEFNAERFNNFIRSYKATEIRKFNSVEAIANSINDQEIDGTHLFDKMNILENIKFEEVKSIYDFFKEEAITSYIVKQK